jgi:hypothetical protein
MQKVIGHVAVDSGQIMIGDPCYLADWKGHDFGDNNPGEYSYAGACTATLSEQGYGELNFAMGHPGAAVACGTRWGDGTYPVTAEFDSDGRVISLTIDFDWSTDDEDETEVMDECERCGLEVEMGTLEGGYCEPCAEMYAQNEMDAESEAQEDDQ